MPGLKLFYTIHDGGDDIELKMLYHIATKEEVKTFLKAAKNKKPPTP